MHVPILSCEPAAATVVVLAAKTREDVDHATFTGTHIDLLSIDECGIQVYFHFVGSRGNVEHLRTIIRRGRLPGLDVIDEDERTLGSTRDDELSRVRRMRFVQTDPTAAGQAGQCNQYEDSQS